ncbi:MAG: hypothetical protein ACJ76J_26630 [Thermoanaerobaculia bacterium]
MKSDYQVFKLWWVSVLPLTKDAIHVYIGFLCLLLALILFRRKLGSFTALIPGILVSITMEVFDLRDGYAWMESVKDVVNTNLIPFLLVLLTRWRTFNF